MNGGIISKWILIALFASLTPCVSAVQTRAPAEKATPSPTVSAPTQDERAARIKARQEQLANDWPNLARYKDADNSLTQPVQVVFMGDSITELWAQRPDLFFPGKAYVSRGIGGQTTPQMLLRFQQDVVALRPKVVVINGGTNDLAGNTGPSTLEMIENNLRSMTEIAQASGIRVVLASITPAYNYPWRKGLEPAEKIVTLNAWMKNFCRQADCTFADYFSSMADNKHGMREELSVDGIHPTVTGYNIMVPIAEQAISQALSQPNIHAR